MQLELPTDHPKQQLLFYVAQDFGEDIPPEVERVVQVIAENNKWLIAPPRFIDDIHASNLGTPVRTVGGVLELYSALPPSDLPLDIDRGHLEEVCQIVEALRRFSAEKKLAFELELDGTFVGAIEDGKIDQTLSEGLIGEWRRELERRSSFGSGSEIRS